MAIPKNKPVISQELADGIDKACGLRELMTYWNELSICSDEVEEIKALYKTHGFDSCTQILAYLWSTKDFSVKESFLVFVEGWVNGVYQMMYIKKEAPKELTSNKSRAKVFNEKDAIEKVKQLELAGLDAYKEEIKGE